jgi:hypothetical protein
MISLSFMPCLHVLILYVINPIVGITFYQTSYVCNCNTTFKYAAVCIERKCTLISIIFSVRLYECKYISVLTLRINFMLRNSQMSTYKNE